MTADALSIDLNADLGEGCPWDLALLDRVTSASVCCGAHAGSPDTMRATLLAAQARGVVVGAHPGYPDREGFGRRERDLSSATVELLVREQLRELAAIAEASGVIVRFVKPHGALYNQAQRDDAIAAGIVAAVAPLRLPVLGLPGSRLAALAAAAGLRFIPEGFADRRYAPDGQLVPRGQPGAILEDPQEIRAQVVRLCEQKTASTLCIHGDNPAAISLADLVRATLAAARIPLRSFV